MGSEFMCGAETYSTWVAAMAEGYDQANPYHNSLHAADVVR